MDTLSETDELIINSLCVYLWEHDYGHIKDMNGTAVIYNEYGYFELDRVLKNGFESQFHTQEDFSLSSEIKTEIRSRYNQMVAEEELHKLPAITHIIDSPYMN